MRGHDSTALLSVLVFAIPCPGKMSIFPFVGALGLALTDGVPDRLVRKRRIISLIWEMSVVVSLRLSGGDVSFRRSRDKNHRHSLRFLRYDLNLTELDDMEEGIFVCSAWALVSSMAYNI